MFSSSCRITDPYFHYKDDQYKEIDSINNKHMVVDLCDERRGCKPRDQSSKRGLQPVQRHQLVRLLHQSQRHLLRPQSTTTQRQQTLCNRTTVQGLRPRLRNDAV